jgi:uncharacterized membrane protein
MDWVGGLARWFHYIAGIAWIGLLYYFNFVQVQGLAAANKAADGGAAGITKYIAPRALQLFRGAAIATWIMGAILLWTLSSSTQNGIVSAFTLQAPYTGIGVGAWLGTIMLFNVVVLIYPNQMKILGIVPATDEQKAKARRIAFLASRTNTMLSLPMLFFMAFGFSHKNVVGL